MDALLRTWQRLIGNRNLGPASRVSAVLRCARRIRRASRRAPLVCATSPSSHHLRQASGANCGGRRSPVWRYRCFASKPGAGLVLGQGKPLSCSAASPLLCGQASASFSTGGGLLPGRRPALPLATTCGCFGPCLACQDLNGPFKWLDLAPGDGPGWVRPCGERRGVRIGPCP